MTKEKLTREKIAADQLREFRALMPAQCILFVIGLVLSVGVFAKTVGEILSTDPSESTAALAVLYTVVLVFAVALCGLTVYSFASYLVGMRRASSGGFYLVRDELSRISLGETVYRWYANRGKLKSEDAFYFYKHGRFVVHARGSSILEYSSAGDTFYLLFYSRRGKIAAIYSTKIYEAEEGLCISDGEGSAA